MKTTQIGGEPVTIRAGYLSGTACACGTASTQITIPAGATSAQITARGGTIFYGVNAASAGTTSPGYVATDMTGYVPPIDNLTALYVAGGGATSVAHIQFFEE